MRIFHEVKGIPENEEKTQPSRIGMKEETSQDVIVLPDMSEENKDESINEQQFIGKSPHFYGVEIFRCEKCKFDIGTYKFVIFPF